MTNHLKKIPAIKWSKGNYKEIEETTVEDENIYLHIDNLLPRKFSTYPEDLEDFAVGYSLGDGLIKNIDEIIDIKIENNKIIIKTKHNHQQKKPKEDQGVMSDSAGGWRTELKEITPVQSDLKITASEIIENMIRLTEKAEIWQKTGSVHVAQLIYKDEKIVREDVSRHVAVDKVIGAAAKKNYDLSQCYVTYSGRMPADMLTKIVRVGIPILISNAAPAGSGFEIANKGNITMIGFVRGDRFNVYTHTERVDFDN